MDEDGAAASRPRAGKIEVENDDDVVAMIVSPEAFMSSAIGQADGTVVAPVIGIVAPAEIGIERGYGQRCQGFRATVGPVEDRQQLESTGRRLAVSLDFLPPNSRSPNRCRQPEARADQDTALGIARRGPDTDVWQLSAAQSPVDQVKALR
jgi:hypothetical protein